MRPHAALECASRWSAGRTSQQPLQRVEARRAVRRRAAPASTASMIAQSGASGRWVQPARALLGDLGELGERAEDVRGVDVPEAERAHAGGVDDPAVAAVAAVAQRHRRGRGVPPAAGDLVHVPGRAHRARDERVHEGRLADARSGRRRPWSARRAAAPIRSSGISSLRAREHLEIEALEVREELGRVGEVGLGDARAAGGCRHPAPRRGSGRRAARAARGRRRRRR